MPSFPNMFNSYSDDHVPSNNHRGFVPIQMNHNSNLVRSMLITSDHTNHGDLFSSSPYPFAHYPNSHLSSSSFGFNSSMMRRNIDSGFVMPQVSRVSNCFPLEENPHFTQISFTETITNRYSAIVPTNTIIPNFQNDFGRVMDSRNNIWNPTIHTPNFHEKQSEILNPEPLNVIFPQQNSPYPQHLDIFTSSSIHNNDQYVSHQDGQLFKKSPKRTKFFEEAIEVLDSEEDEESEDERYDGRTHSIKYQKYGPYTCPKCNGVFDTSQKFAAHMSTHYKNETKKEKEKRFRARNKKRYRKLNHEVHQESQKIKLADGDNNGGISAVEGFQYPVVVKEEHV